MGDAMESRKSRLLFEEGGVDAEGVIGESMASWMSPFSSSSFLDGGSRTPQDPGRGSWVFFWANTRERIAQTGPMLRERRRRCCLS